MVKYAGISIKGEGLSTNTPRKRGRENQATTRKTRNEESEFYLFISPVNKANYPRATCGEDWTLVSPSLAPYHVLNLVILGERVRIVHLFISLSVSPSLPHDILESLNIQVSTHDGLGEWSDRLGITKRLQFHIEVRGNEQDCAQSTHTRGPANTMFGGGNPATAQDNRTPTSQDNRGISGDRNPHARGFFELQTGRAILEDNGKGPIIHVGSASIRRVGGSRVRIVVTQAIVHIV
jgi:hypothetical protein